MEIINCTWERKNLDSRVAEVIFSANEIFDGNKLMQLQSEYDYIVVKTPQLSFRSATGLSELGFSFIEAQISAKVNINKLNEQICNDKVLSRFWDCCKFDIIDSNEEIDLLLSNISNGMFNTDRIYIDPLYGPDYSSRRYRNWILAEYERGSTILKLYYRGTYVGFSMVRIGGGIITGLLAGIFEKYQNAGFGMLVTAYPLCFANQANLFTGKISSNNMPIIKMYERFHYEWTSIEYVYVKHISHKDL